MIEADEARRLEDLWAGGFGAAYIERNQDAGAKRGAAWERIFGDERVASLLEVGSNLGGNLQHVVARVDGPAVGVDINEGALVELARRTDARPVAAAARALPFRDSSFDVVMTVGVLIHQPESSLLDVMSEIVRCSARLVICGEYEAEGSVEVPYRGERGALFKRGYGRIYEERFGLERVATSIFDASAGFDDVTFHVLRLPLS